MASVNKTTDWAILCRDTPMFIYIRIAKGVFEVYSNTPLLRFVVADYSTTIYS